VQRKSCSSSCRSEARNFSGQAAHGAQEDAEEEVVLRLLFFVLAPLGGIPAWLVVRSLSPLPLPPLPSLPPLLLLRQLLLQLLSPRDQEAA
jgi:hypothetical protein